MSLVYGVCVGDWGKFTANVAPRVGSAPLITVYNATSIASAYNAILRAAAQYKPTAVVLLHDDLALQDAEDWLDRKITEIIDDEVGVVGCIGAREVRSLAWWEGQIVGRQETDSGWVHGESPDASGMTDVDAVDGSLMIVNGWQCRNMRFDESYTGFHGYDVDFCAQVRAEGMRVGVASIRTHHHTTLGFKGADVHRAWLAAYETYRGKWSADVAVG